MTAPSAPPMSVLSASSTDPALLNLLGVIADALAQIARNTAPAAPEEPNYQRPLEMYAGFDWHTIDAEIIASDRFGPTIIEWSGQLWKRRSPENKFGAAVWYSRSAGKDDAGNNRYLRLITFKPIGDVEPLSRAAETAVATAPTNGHGHPPSTPSTASTSSTPDQDFDNLPSASAALATPPTLLATDTTAEIWRSQPDLACPNCGRAYQYDNPDCPRHTAQAINHKPGRQAVIAAGRPTVEFRQWAGKFAAAHPYYQLRNGEPDLYHILTTAASEFGVTDIALGNMPYVQARLREYARAKHPAENAGK